MGASSAAFALDAPLPAGGLRIGEVIEGSPLWAEWSRRFLRPSGRVIDTASRDASHSEGQGYGMLLAVAAGDREAFDSIWKWTRANLMVRADHLAAWRWDPVKRAVSDRNNATDGDILIAWALAEAADLWQSVDYAEAGAEIARDISRKLIVDAVGVGPVLLPAAFGFAAGDQSDGPVVNLSYWVMPAFARLAQLAPERDWDAVRRTGLAIIDAIQARQPGVVTDWTSLAGGKASPARRFPPKAGYDAMRVPLYLAFSKAANADRIARAAQGQPAVGRGLPIVNVETGVSDEIAGGRGYRSLAALRSCAAFNQPFPRDFYWLGENDAYYPATLHMMALVAALSQKDACFDPVEARALQPFGWTKRFASDLPRAPVVSAPIVSAPGELQLRPSEFQVAAAPAQEQQEGPAYASSWSFLSYGAPIVTFATIVGLIGLSRRRRPDDPVAQSPSLNPPERSPAPRHLPQNPFLALRGEHALEQRLDISAAASHEWKRTSAVAYFRMANYEEFALANGVEAAQRLTNDVIGALAGQIRKSDAAALLGPDEIAVCLSLIADDADLNSIGRRLTAALLSAYPQAGPTDQAFGLALYPWRGGSGAECLKQARAEFFARHPEIEERPSLQAKPRRKRAVEAALAGSFEWSRQSPPS